MTTSTFDMAKVSAKTKKSGATWKQCKALGYHLAKKSSTGKPDWVDSSRITACLAKDAADGKFSFLQASKLFQAKKLPAKYRKAIADYVAANQEVDS
jgi:hypothetical protein|tara:strand:- start:1633 stop:1923 length:291 start_codon:yes stop_codon:yes gene_type:complete